MLRRLLLLLAAPAAHALLFATLAVNTTGLPLNTVDALFQGVNIDTGTLYHGAAFGPALTNLAAALAPGQLRIGGGAADALLYDPEGGYGAGPNIFPNGLNGQVTRLNSAALRNISSFARNSGLSLLWDVNGFAFRVNVTWGAYNATGTVPPQNSTCPACTVDAPFDLANTNLTALLAQISGEDLCVDGLELGNEPDLWWRYGLKLSGGGSAADLIGLQGLLAANYSSAGLKIAGPSWAGFNAANAGAFFTQMGGAGPYQFTSHEYPISNSQQGNSKSGCDVPSYLDVSKFVDPSKGLSSNVGTYVAALASSGAAPPLDPLVSPGTAVPRDPTAPRMVLEETATSALGGCANYSDRFISGFFTLNALTTPFERGYQQVNLQDLNGWSFTARPSQYALVGQPGWTGGGDATEVSPSYFAIVLLRQLLGPVALAATLSPGITQDPLLAVHAWCAGAHGGPVPSGAVVLVYTNSHNDSVSLNLTAPDGSPVPLGDRVEYHLTAPDTTPTVTGLLAKAVLLNGVPLTINPNGTLPVYPFPGVSVSDGGGSVVLPPLAYGFIVLRGAGAGTCATRPTLRAPIPTKNCNNPPSAASADDFPTAIVVSVVAVLGAAVVGGIVYKNRLAKSRKGGEYGELPPA